MFKGIRATDLASSDLAPWHKRLHLWDSSYLSKDTLCKSMIVATDAGTSKAICSARVRYQAWII